MPNTFTLQVNRRDPCPKAQNILHFPLDSSSYETFILPKQKRRAKARLQGGGSKAVRSTDEEDRELI